MIFVVNATLLTGERQAKEINAIDRIIATDAVMKIFSKHKEIAFMTISQHSLVTGVNSLPFVQIQRNPDARQ